MSIIDILNWRKDPDNYDPDRDEFEDCTDDEPLKIENSSWTIVHDESANDILCDCWGAYIHYNNNSKQYECPNYGRVFSRSEFFSRINADPPLDECSNCRENYLCCRLFCSDLENENFEYWSELTW